MKSKENVEKRPFRHKFLFPIILALLLGLLLEKFIRISGSGDFVNRGGYGFVHFSQDLKIPRFVRNLANGEKYDFIFIGNSLADRAFNPSAFARGFAETGGIFPRSFNFAFHGLTTNRVRGVTNLVRRLTPRSTVIWGCSLLDFVQNHKKSNYPPLMENDWLRYRVDQWNLRGWLVEHSAGIRWFSLLRLGLEFPASRDLHKKYFQYGQENGYFLTPIKKPKLAGIVSQRLIQWASVPRKSVRHDIKNRLSSILPEAHESSFMLILLPIHERLWKSIRIAGSHPKLDAARIVQTCRGLGFRAMDTTRKNHFEDRHWKNLNHLGPLGAVTYSHWFGRQLGLRYGSGRLKPASVKEP